MENESFEVHVTRHSKNEDGTESYFGMFVSKVYAINGNSFLVYDPGEWDVLARFVWVDFTELMTDINDKESYVSCVELWAGD